MASATITTVEEQKTTPFVLLVTTSVRTIALDPTRTYTFSNLAIDGTEGFATASVGIVKATFSRTQTASATPQTAMAADDNNLMLLPPNTSRTVGPFCTKVTILATATVLVDVQPTEAIGEASR